MGERGLTLQWGFREEVLSGLVWEGDGMGRGRNWGRDYMIRLFPCCGEGGWVFNGEGRYADTKRRKWERGVSGS